MFPLNIQLPHDPREKKTYVQTSTCMFTAGLFTVAKQWKQPDVINWGRDETWPIHAVEGCLLSHRRNELLTPAASLMDLGSLSYT